MNKPTLGESFGERLKSKPGTQTIRLENLAAVLGPNNGGVLAEELKKTGHQMAGLLEAMARPDLGLVTSYEKGYPKAGMASGPAREALGLNIDPTRAFAKKL